MYDKAIELLKLINNHLKNNLPFAIRLKSTGDAEKTFKILFIQYF